MIPTLNIIGESINDSVPSTNALFESGDFSGISELARFQQEKGAVYIDVNVGGRSPDFMRQTVQAVLSSTTLPLSIDSPDFELARNGLESYDPARGKPILNSISPLRTAMFDLYKIQPFRPILLVSEYIGENGEEGPTQTAEETFAAAEFLFREAKKYGIPNEDMIFDPGIAPVGSDTEGNLTRLIGAMDLIHQNPEMAGVHMSVGLSNFTVMLPPKTKSGQPVKGPLESAFLTIAMPKGLDHVIGSVKRKYELLAEDHPAMACVRDCIQTGGFEAIMRVREFYTN